MELKRGWNSRENDHRSGRQKASTPDELVNAIHRIVLDDRCFTAQKIAKSIGIYSYLVLTVLFDIMGMNKLFAI